MPSFGHRDRYEHEPINYQRLQGGCRLLLHYYISEVLDERFKG